MTPAQRDLILHALGLTPRNGRMRRWSHRNFYDWEPHNLQNNALLESMARSGWVSGEMGHYYITFHVTRSGAEAAGVLERCRVKDVER